MMNDFNAGTVSQATIQITASIDETFFCHVAVLLFLLSLLRRQSTHVCFMAWKDDISLKLLNSAIYGMTNVSKPVEWRFCLLKESWIRDKTTKEQQVDKERSLTAYIVDQLAIHV